MPFPTSQTNWLSRTSKQPSDQVQFWLQYWISQVGCVLHLIMLWKMPRRNHPFISQENIIKRMISPGRVAQSVGVFPFHQKVVVWIPTLGAHRRWPIDVSVSHWFSPLISVSKIDKTCPWVRTKKNKLKTMKRTLRTLLVKIICSHLAITNLYNSSNIKCCSPIHKCFIPFYLFVWNWAFKNKYPILPSLICFYICKEGAI